MDEFDNLDVTRENGIAWLAMESETPMNTWNDGLKAELSYLVTEFTEDEDVRCIVLRGSDGVFSAGGDLSANREGNRSAGLRRRVATLHDLVVQFKRAETPLVTGIDGPAVGAGFSIALLGDVSIVREGAFLQYGYSGIGMTSDGGGTFYLPRLVGLQEAKRIALLNPRIYGEEAAELGLVTEVVSDDEFEDRLAEVARRIADGPTKALGRIVRLLEESSARQLPEQLAAETDVMARTARTEDSLEGRTAFREKREPEFAGR